MVEKERYLSLAQIAEMKTSLPMIDVVSKITVVDIFQHEQVNVGLYFLIHILHHSQHVLN